MTFPVLLGRSRYRELGGEDAAFEADVALLEANGHRVVVFERSNADAGRVGAGLAAPWSRDARRALVEVLRRERPRVAHFHNTFPLLSASVYAACRAEGVPVVQTLHNYRLVCPDPVLFRGGHACHDCVGRAVPWPGVVHACYRGSRVETTVAAAAALVQRRAGGLLVDWFVVPSAYARDVLAGVLPDERVVVRHNAVHPSFEQVARGPGGSHVLFAGRLVPEKGLDVLRRLAEHVEIHVAGDGPARDVPGLRYLGHLGRAELMAAMASARAVVVPSLAPESFGLVVMVAFACGVPVVASAIGALPEVVDDGRNGFLVPVGDVEGFARRLNDPALASMRSSARATYEASAAPAVAYARLLDVYRAATNDAA